MDLYAHSKVNEPETSWQTLDAHLKGVSKLCKEFAGPFGAGEWAAVVGLVHDIGKASEAFQRRIRGSNEKVDHSTAGAQLLFERYGSTVGVLLAYLCAGHHGGLPNMYGTSSALSDRLAASGCLTDEMRVLVMLPDAQQMAQTLPSPLKSMLDEGEDKFAAPFFLHMLYSCLVDADWLDTENFCDAERYRLRNNGTLPLSAYEASLNQHFQNLDSKAQPTVINQARNAIREECLAAACSKSGIFTLNVPTGGGKTLSSMAFALRHALANGQKRIIYCIPYTSIVEQTARVYKEIFGRDAVLEHHSNYALDDYPSNSAEEAASVTLSAENWDSSLIVTTNVQFFESLYANKPSKSRRIHNIANSVVVLDEVQSLPDHLLKPCLAAMEELSAHYSTSFVLCTATQPDYERIWPFGTTVTDIVPKEKRNERLFEERVTIDYDGLCSQEDLVEQLLKENQVLCVVSSRRAAGALYDEVVFSAGTEGVFHLSAQMTPAHRSECLSEIRKVLSEGGTCRVISTQLIEAGVDVDFPVVYRELAGIDSIRQAAGRCNREGKLACGAVHVFECDSFPSLKGDLATMKELGRETITQIGDSFGETGISYFFKRRFAIRDTDSYQGTTGKGLVKALNSPDNFLKANYAFADYAEHFRFIDDEGVSVVIPHNDHARALLDSYEKGLWGVRQSRQLQSYTITIPVYMKKQLDVEAALIQVGPYLVLEPIQGCERFYSSEKGLEILPSGEALFV
ncbi:MAG: CRISPR-associated helicase Cas3' [Coriobacteriia bacterium]|nr:CRISPR-associated helicase Cas3' [Coriobacteriia bacterium]